MSKLEEAKEILSSLKVPAKQQNGMCCCVLLAMANLTEEQAWGSAANNWIMIFNVSRIIRANPSDEFQAFNYFKEAYHEYDEYTLMPAVVNERTGQIKPLPKYGIHKKQLIYRHISDITENDQDAILLRKNKPYKPYKSR